MLRSYREHTFIENTHWAINNPLAMSHAIQTSQQGHCTLSTKYCICELKSDTAYYQQSIAHVHLSPMGTIHMNGSLIVETAAPQIKLS